MGMFWEEIKGNRSDISVWEYQEITVQAECGQCFPTCKWENGPREGIGETTENPFCWDIWDSEVERIETDLLGSQPVPTWDFILHKAEETFNYLETK